jgi:hypothetical protein
MEHILCKQLIVELGLTPGFIEYHSTLGRIPAPTRFGQNRIYSRQDADVVREYVESWKSRTRKGRAKEEKPQPKPKRSSEAPIISTPLRVPPSIGDAGSSNPATTPH